MAETTNITVVKRQTSFAQKACNHLLFWSVLMGAAGGSRIWFGGAWIIDLIAAIMAFGALVVIMRGALGYSVDLTQREIKEWVADGMPADVKLWKAAKDGSR